MGNVMRAVQQVSAELPEPLAAELVAATLRWDHPKAASVIDQLAGSAIGAVLAVDRVARALADSACGCDDPDHAPYLDPQRGRYESDLVLPHARRLGGRADLTAGLMACALTRHHGPRAGWSAPWRDLLRELRRHPHSEVIYAAAQVRTADE